MNTKLVRLLGLMAGGLLLEGAASADVVTVSYYRLGENDPGAVAGNPVNAMAVDSGGAGVNLYELGAVPPTYSANTGVAGSTLSITVNGGGYTNGAPILALTDNWGIEAWVFATNTQNSISSDGYAQIAYNGNSGPSGMGLYSSPSGQFIGLVGGKAVVGGAPITPNTWTHLAMVVADGATTFYVNGVANATGPAPAAPAGFFGIGINPSKPGGWEQFQGSIDEVRVFMVVPETFTTDDLLLTNVPPPPQPATIVAGPTAVPGNQLAYGSALSLTVLAGGTAPIQYQWWQGTKLVPGATNATLSFSSVTASNAGSYSVVVGNVYGPATTSAVVNVTVIVPSVTGSVIPVAYYRLGENDPGAANGQVGDAATVDIVSGLNLSVVGDSSTYSANTGVHGSTLSLAVDGAGGYNYATPIITNSGNWGLEAWVMSTNADNGGQGAIVLNGDFTAGNGLGIFQRGTQWQGLVTGLAWIGGATVVPNTWTHLAIVASASNTTFYVNGVANGTGPVPKPATSGDFSIGYDEYNGTPEPFQGLIDEVRAFTVLAGQFAVNDLLLNEVPPAPEAPSPFSALTFTPAAVLSVSNNPAYLSGQSLSISAVFAGTSPLQFQWRQGTNPVPGATNATLSFSSLTTNNAGNYTVVVTNVYGAATSSVAAVTVLPPGLYPVAYYRLGENDPGAANGQVANPQTVDFAGSVNLWQLGEPPTYTNNTGVAGSTLCITVNGGGYTNGAPFALSGNWGIEAWAKADVAVPSLSTDGYSQIAYNGNSGPGGMGLYQTPGGTFAGLCGGVALVGGAPVVPGTWTHLAMVNAGGTTTFYVNGVAAGTGPAPNPPPSYFGVGINPSGAGGGEPFQGSIDEVRVFTFSPGSFAVNDLLLNQVPPGHEAAAVLSGPTLTPGPTVLSGSSLSMSVQAAGTSPLQFQWFHNGAPIPGATTAILSFTNVTASASGAYYVTVTNAYGSGISGVATVTVFPPGSGSITEVAYYRLGENDPGAANGQVGNATTVDVVSGLNLSSVANSSSYSANTGVPGSTLCLAVDGGGYTNVPVQLSGNWGLEAWAYSTNANNSAPGYGDVAFNGNYAGSGGMGFFQIGTHWNGLVSGIAWLPSPGGGPTVVPNTWTHLAIVTTGGTTTFYVNGVVAATGPAPAPVTGVGDFSIGFDANPYAGNASYFQGLIDEVRLFTFAPGQFTTNNLLLARVPPTPSLSILPVGGSVSASGGNLFVTWSVGNLLQAHTLAGPWITVTNATSPWLTPMVGPSGYFRAVAP